ncbi:MAG: acyl-CoA/acyl-ACP dehydrogenase [Acetobacteraceae bacterium]|nr:acyl-CoA/acyl-ACP dehydrogenase [Acetobacteraceae bacterium]
MSSFSADDAHRTWNNPMPVEDNQEDVISMLRRSAAAVTRVDGGLRRVRRLRFQQLSYAPPLLCEMAQMGWTGLLVAEEAGGSGLGMRGLCALLEELGRSLVPEPLAEAAVVAPFLTGQIGEDHRAGATLVLPALHESANDLQQSSETRFAEGRVSGCKQFILGAAGASAFLVSAKDRLVLVRRDAEGVRLELSPTVDGGSFGTLTLDNAQAEPITGNPVQLLDACAMATSGYLLGVMEAALILTVEYLKVRVQFGRPIGAFQALQHEAADMKILLELARAGIESAAAVYDGAAPQALRSAAVSRAKARASEASVQIAKEAIQLHGAIGYTDEHDIGLYLRKAMTLSNLYGSSRSHRARFASLQPQDEPD